MKALTILMYHAISDRILPHEAAFTTPPLEFERQMTLLRDLGYQAVTMGEVVEAWRQGASLPPKAVVITFDDGFDCVVNTAMPIMLRRDIRATVYVIAGYLGLANTYDQAYKPTQRRIVSASELRVLHSAGIEIGSHTVSHRRLSSIADEEITTEVADSKEILEDVLGSPLRSFAYPYGAFTKRARDIVRTSGYTSAVSTMSGRNHERTDRFVLRRATVGAGHSDRAFTRLLRWGGEPSEIVVNSIRGAVRFLVPKRAVTEKRPLRDPVL